MRLAEQGDTLLVAERRPWRLIVTFGVLCFGVAVLAASVAVRSPADRIGAVVMLGGVALFGSVSGRILFTRIETVFDRSKNEVRYLRSSLFTPELQAISFSEVGSLSLVEVDDRLNGVRGWAPAIVLGRRRLPFSTRYDANRETALARLRRIEAFLTDGGLSVVTSAD